jgi:SAM-dependent methyltransferase
MRKHPAKFSPPIVETAARHLQGISLLGQGGVSSVLDPFAGTGLVHSLRMYGDFKIVGVEIEPEWAEMHPRTVIGDALALPFRDSSFDAVLTSPTYGNRLADHHDAKDGSTRRSYKHDLGRDLHPNNSGMLHWGEEYRIFHRIAWDEVRRVVRPGGRFILNMKNHIRSGEEQPVTEWHVDTLIRSGWKLRHIEPIPAKGMRYGQNHQARVSFEFVLVFDSP